MRLYAFWHGYCWIFDLKMYIIIIWIESRFNYTDIQAIWTKIKMLTAYNYYLVVYTWLVTVLK